MKQAQKTLKYVFIVSSFLMVWIILSSNDSNQFNDVVGWSNIGSFILALIVSLTPSKPKYIENNIIQSGKNNKQKTNINQ